MIKFCPDLTTHEEVEAIWILLTAAFLVAWLYAVFKSGGDDHV